MGFNIENGKLIRYTEEKGVTEVVIPEGVTSIEKKAFYYCSRLSSVNIPDSVTDIKNGAFSYCLGLTYVMIPDSVTNIEENAFFRCKNLISVRLPDRIASIERCVFYCCYSLISVTIPDSVTNIKDCAFYGCKSLNSVMIPDNVISIGEQSFYCCRNLTSVMIPDNVKNIRSRAFSECPHLILTISEVKLPAERIKKDDLNKVYAMLKTRNFSAEVTDEVKYAFLVGDYLKTNHADAEEYIRKNFLDIARFLIDYDNREAIAKFIRMKKFFTKENTDELLQYAIEQEKHEITLMLTDNKHKMGWYDHPADRMKL